MTTATLTDAATVTLAFPLAAVEGLRHAITLAIHERPTSERDMLASIYGALVNPQPAPTVRAACAPVDVLAVMDLAAGLLIGCPDDDVAEDCSADVAKARAAVAELIEAAESALRREEFKQGPDAGNDGLVRRLRAALARVGGGK